MQTSAQHLHKYWTTIMTSIIYSTFTIVSIELYTALHRFTHESSTCTESTSWRFRESQVHFTSGSNEGSSFGVSHDRPSVKNCQICDNRHKSVLANHGQDTLSVLKLYQIVRMVWSSLFVGISVFIMPSRTLTNVEVTSQVAFYISSLSLHCPQNRSDEPPRSKSVDIHVSR